VEHAAAQCGEKGVKGLLVISAGFSETGGEGTERQRRLMDIARRYGMRVIGPNCMGIMNTQPEISLDATFSPVAPDPGTLAFSSQSGALGIAVIEQAKRLGLGISSFVSVGNKADISGNDLLQYWEQDSNTEVILLYLESFGNPRKFARIARRIARRKPIVAVKSGRSEAGARAAASHTGSLVAGDIAVDALFRQAGVVRTDTLEELFDVARVFADQPAPEGSNVGILTNAGGLGILCADACEAAGLRVPQLSDRTQEALKNLLPAEAGISNPVDMIASATPEQYGAALRLLLSDDDIDSVIVIFISPLVTRGEDVADAVVEAVRSSRSKTVLTCFLGSPEAMDRLSSPGVSIPAYSFPESAARALGRVTDYARWKAKPDGDVVVPEGIDRSKAAGLCAGFLEDGGRWLTPLEVSALLECYGIPHVRTRTARDPEEVERAAAELSFPVAVKIDSRSILHKTDVGGVRLDLDTPAAAGDAARAIVAELERRNIADELDGFVVQEMVTDAGAEMFLGMTHDPLFGPLLACGAGGTLVELIRDVTVRISPLTDVDAQEMLRSLKTYPLFEGYRGQPPLDRRAMEELLLRLSAMVEDLALLSEIDFNPVLVSAEGKGCTVVDARIRISTPAPQPPRGARTVT
ncbi:MAG TPA: acetate--CoA ligase family protein, partial [Actinomycetota bacterium]|nr:acetate--CoA ligase family protein [Actinomycetota bacterium]